MKIGLWYEKYDSKTPAEWIDFYQYWYKNDLKEVIICSGRGFQLVQGIISRKRFYMMKLLIGISHCLSSYLLCKWANTFLSRLNDAIFRGQ